MDAKKYIQDAYTKGIPIKEIADKLGISPNAVQKRAARDKDCPQHGSFFDRGKIGTEAHLQGEEAMRDPTKAELQALQTHCEVYGLPLNEVLMWWHKTREFSVCFKSQKAIDEYENLFAKFLEQVKKQSPGNKKPPLPTKTLAIPANFDIHIGKHCEMIRSGNEYTPEKAIGQVKNGMASMYALTKPFDVSDILLPLGNDIVHIDNNNNTTTSGTPQDSYGSVESQMLLAAQLYIGLIEEMSEHHNVWLCHVHSNHDRVAGWSVSRIVAAHFHNNPRVKWTEEGMSQQHRKYFVFGDNLIMFHHGEAKEEKLMGLIEAEARLAVSQTKRTYVYQGHTHHKTLSKRGVNTDKLVEKDHSSLSVIRAGNGAHNRLHVETVRSPSPADGWHSEKGYLSMPAVEMFLHNEHSQFARFTHWFG